MTKRSRTMTAMMVVFCSMFLLLSASWAPAQEVTPVNLGQDGNKMQWYVVNYGKNDQEHFAAARRYYTNVNEKKTIVELLMSKFNIAKETADTLYFTEYGYVYSKDGKQFALSYLNHYDMVGQVIYSTEYPAESREYVVMSSNMVPYKAYQYATGKKVAPAVKRNTAPKVVK